MNQKTSSTSHAKGGRRESPPSAASRAAKQHRRSLVLQKESAIEQNELDRPLAVCTERIGHRRRRCLLIRQGSDLSESRASAHPTHHSQRAHSPSQRRRVISSKKNCPGRAKGKGRAQKLGWRPVRRDSNTHIARSQRIRPPRRG